MKKSKNKESPGKKTLKRPQQTWKDMEMLMLALPLYLLSFCQLFTITDTEPKMSSGPAKGRFAPTGSMSGGLPVFHCEAAPSHPEMYR